MYSFDSRVRYSDIGHKGTMTLPALINYFQDCSTFQSEDIGVGVEVLKKRKKAWILSYWQIVIERFPKVCEQITIGTFATGFKGLYGNRNFIMLDSEENRVAYANSVWVFMDTEKGRPARPGDEDVLPYGMEPPLEMEYEDRKIKLPVSSEACPSFPVRKYHIDTNEHVNNCQYVQMALEMLPDDMDVHQLRVDYKQSAKYGDIIFPRVAFETERTMVELCDRNGKPYTVIEFK
ncbi:acyl-[acyl-carrier-protein] thioesterase [Clostridium sp. C105KSO13]|uniref:acyl-[acyl-carrier-protein] thioesterase n=1 Tax=Clostridium sp. C105KSO13 TaxID=1776045 RepID=UPI0007405C56|nr:acyl-ACP thioesterase domain-containing protein [Clostridium sp. C105KSO13]CUX24548.1 Acyl-ACP thioesterase [Clostridium sp. C105KSO13]